MDRITRLKMSLYKDIFMTLFLVLVSIPIWLSFDVKDLKEAYKYQNYNYINYEFLSSPKYELVSVSDDYALKNIETQDLVVYNFTKADASYSLVLKINKNSTAIIDDIKVNVNYHVSYLNSFNSYEDVNYYYYILDSDHIQGTSQIYVLSMWNDEQKKQNNDTIFDYQFVVM